MAELFQHVAEVEFQGHQFDLCGHQFDPCGHRVGSPVRGLIQASEMTITSAIFALLAAFMHAVGFVMNRRYVVVRQATSAQLLVVSHAWMGLVAALALVAVRPHDLPELGVFVRPLVAAASTYATAQGFFYFALRRSDASRVSPLLGMKIIAVALLYSFWLGHEQTPGQWAAVGISGLAVFFLKDSGSSLPGKVICAMLAAVFCFSLSEVYISELLSLAMGTITLSGRYQQGRSFDGASRRRPWWSPPRSI